MKTFLELVMQEIERNSHPPTIHTSRKSQCVNVRDTSEILMNVHVMLYECSLCAVKVSKLCVPLLGSHHVSTLVDRITVCPKRVRRQTGDRMCPSGQQGYWFNALLSHEHTLTLCTITNGTIN